MEFDPCTLNVLANSVIIALLSLVVRLLHRINGD
jgi:hypothetical protein